MEYVEFLVLNDDGYKYCGTYDEALALKREMPEARIYAAAYYPVGNNLLQRQWAEVIAGWAGAAPA